MELDRIDCELIEYLQNDARLSNKELASAVGLAPSSCLARVQRLRSEGVLKGAHAEVDPDALGVGLQALIAVQLRQHSRAQVKAFWKHVLGLPEVLMVFHVAGTHDFQVHVAVRDAQIARNLAVRWDREHWRIGFEQGLRTPLVSPEDADASYQAYGAAERATIASLREKAIVGTAAQVAARLQAAARTATRCA